MDNIFVKQLRNVAVSFQCGEVAKLWTLAKLLFYLIFFLHIKLNMDDILLALLHFNCTDLTILYLRKLWKKLFFPKKKKKVFKWKTTIFFYIRWLTILISKNSFLAQKNVNIDANRKNKQKLPENSNPHAQHERAVGAALPIDEVVGSRPLCAMLFFRQFKSACLLFHHRPLVVTHMSSKLVFRLKMQSSPVDRPTEVS